MSRTREQASDFNAALADHLQTLRRAQEAQRMREEYEAAALERRTADPSSSQSVSDLSLKPGQTMILQLKPVRPCLTGATILWLHTEHKFTAEASRGLLGIERADSVVAVSVG